ncbi:MAG: type I-MYXAN CRISPR-associated protein Cmx8 [Rivularia sp. (in: cyanobacteria)]
MEELRLNYQLAALPSAQHRAGLAGLVLMVEYLHRQPDFLECEEAVFEVEDLDEFGVKLRLNLSGLKALFDITYKAFEDERTTETKIKKYHLIEEKEVKDKKGKTKLVKRYVYKVTVPHGAFLVSCDKSCEDEKNGIWIKLWRDMLWQIVRGVPSTRKSFNSRVNNTSYSQDVEKIWVELQQPDKIVGQSGNYFLGAMASNPENVRTFDKVSYQFLLHFWVFVVQVYCPATLDKDGKRELAGYALAIPDVANLIDFCDEFPQALKERKLDKRGYLPRNAIIDLAEEGALDLFLLLQNRIAHKSARLEYIILGIEIIHAQKIGNNVKIRSISKVEPIDSQVDKYKQILESYWCPWFRKQRLLNLLKERKNPWDEFDAVLSRIPRKWLEDSLFSHDARELFKNEVGMTKMKQEIREYAQIVYQVCLHYVLSKLESKYDLKWDKCKGNPNKEEEYNTKKYKIANEAFLAVRSRSEKQAFIDYFVSTLYPFIKKSEFADFAQKLFQETDEIRALTLLALSSQFPASKKSENKTSQGSALSL